MISVSIWQIEEADISKEVKQYTYKDGDQYVFMDLVSLSIPKIYS